MFKLFKEMLLYRHIYSTYMCLLLHLSTFSLCDINHLSACQEGVSSEMFSTTVMYTQVKN